MWDRFAQKSGIGQKQAFSEASCPAKVWSARKLSNGADQRESTSHIQALCSCLRAQRTQPCSADIGVCGAIVKLLHPARDSSTLPVSLLLLPCFEAPSSTYTATGLPTFSLLTPTCFAIKSVETRQHLVRVVLVEGITVAAASSRSGLSVRSASRYLGFFRHSGGDFHYAPERCKRHTDDVTDPWLRAADLTAVDEQPEIFLDETADAVNYLAGEVGAGGVVLPVTVGRLLSRNGLTRKVMERACKMRIEEQRALWVEAQWKIPLRCRVLVGEAHRVGWAAERRWAWSLRGTRADCYVEAKHGVRTSVFVAMAHGQILDWMVTRPPPGQTSVDFLVFMNNFLLPRMRTVEEGLAWEQQPNRCVLVLDHARNHDEVSLEVLWDASAFALSLPPYYPDFNPNEDVFSVGSSWLRRCSSQAQFNARPMLTIGKMLLHFFERMSKAFVRAAVRR